MAENPARLSVRIVAVDQNVWEGEATMLAASTTEGALGVLPGHAPLLGQLLEDSSVRIYTDGSVDGTPTHEFIVSGGYLSVTDEGVSVLVENAETPAAV